MTSPDRLTCPRCQSQSHSSDAEGCRRCAEEGFAVNLVYDFADLTSRKLGGYGGGPWAWRDTLPLAEGTTPVTLGEGNSELVSVSGTEDLWIKCEFRNPTGSHKDRAASVGVTFARDAGASHVVAASSGNAGAAAAAYAARAGLSCVVLTTPGLKPALQALIQAYGASLITLPDSFQRNQLMGMTVTEHGWFPMTNFVDPGAGSHPAMVEGYKSIAYELARDLADDLGAVVVPTSRADLLSGIARGFHELRDAGLHSGDVQIVAAEPSTGSAFVDALSLNSREDQLHLRVTRHDSPAFSIGSDCTNWQGLAALWAFGERAVSVTPEEMVLETLQLARTDGLFLEVSSAVAVSAARRIRGSVDGAIVAMGTAGGLRQPDVVLDTASTELPLIGPSLDSLDRVLAQLSR